MNLLDKTLFLVTCGGDKHEDHIPQYIMPLSKIKYRISIFSYEKLLQSLLSNNPTWVTEIEFVQDENRFFTYHPVINALIDKYFVAEKLTDDEYQELVQSEALFPRQFFPLKFDGENVCKIDYL
jgi:hypothetical protein